jgi:hypothetical protein
MAAEATTLDATRMNMYDGSNAKDDGNSGTLSILLTVHGYNGNLAYKQVCLSSLRICPSKLPAYMLACRFVL